MDYGIFYTQEKMKKLYSVLSYLLIYILLALSLYYKYQWASNILVFISILSTLSFIGMFTNKEGLQEYNDPKGRHLSKITDEILYTGIILILVGYSHWFLAVIWTINGNLDIELRDKANKLKTKE